MSPIRIFIADDHTPIVELLPVRLRDFGFELAGVTLVPAEVIPQYSLTKPDVVILDIVWGDARGGDTGLALTGALVALDPDVKIVIYSQHEQIEMVSEAYRLGCRAYVPKSTPISDLADIIKRVYEGELYFLPSVAKQLATIHIKGNSSPRALLAPRELEIFKLMASGKSISEIAEAMNLGHKTVSVIAPQIKKKLGVHSSAELTILAVKYGLINIE